LPARLPTQVMLELLGLPDRDENMMRHWSDRCSNFPFQLSSRKRGDGKRAARNLDAQQAYFMPLIDAPHRAPVEDMISATACAEMAGERLSDLEILATCNVIATAGGLLAAAPLPCRCGDFSGFPISSPHLKRVLNSSISPPRSSSTVAK
jgi:cytochrome P450